MNTFRALTLSLAFAGLFCGYSAAAPNDAAISEIIDSYLPGTSGFGKIKVNDVSINDAKKQITITLNETANDLPLTQAQLAELKSKCLASFGDKYAKYKINFLAKGKNLDKDLDKLALFAPKKTKGPKEKDAFVTRVGAPVAPDGLDGANIAIWQSHGWYFEPKLNRWEWQRARIFQTVEDLYTQSYVMPFLMPMLENAGAYVMSPRERDVNRTEIIIDNDPSDYTAGSVALDGNWTASSQPAFAYTASELHNGDNPFRAGTAITASKDAKASWQADIPADGTYAVYVSYTSEPKSSKTAKYRVNAADGPHDFIINQRMGGRTWVYLGHFPLKATGTPQAIVELTADGTGTVSADAVKIGGGMGNVARIVKEPLDSIDYEYVLSGYPRFTEGARYWLQWAGAPDSVFSPSDYVNDYTDDYRSRGLWVNWLTGGSSMLPKREGLNIPIDLSFAFHTDAGTTLNDSIIGTLGIYCTAGNKYANGSDRLSSRDYTDLVMTNIVDDIRATYEPNWTRRGMWDQSYYEARVPEVPSMLLELLSHQNLADMSYGLDPEFRFVVSRAIYKGMLKFLAHRDGRPFVVQPLPVRAFAISHTGGDSFRLSWAETVDSLEETAHPTYYIIEERVDDGAFRRISTVEEPYYEFGLTDHKIHSYRIIAANAGGLSFPSEVLAMCNKPGKFVTVVNGFTRVSAPDRFDSGEIAGFYDVRDHGVPYMQDISFIGSQFEFRRNIPWMDDDAAGFGASRANYEDKVIAGNTFDYPYIHGKAIVESGRPFISSSLEAFCASTDTVATLDLILGKQKETRQGRAVFGTRFKAFPSALQQRMAALAAAGTDMFVSGAYVATDIWDNPCSDEATAEADKAFARDVLGFNWRVDQASVTGEAYQVPTRFKDFGKGTYKFSNELNPDCYVVESPDSFYPADDATGCTFMRYTENNLIAGTALDKDSYRAVVIGFPFETITSATERTHLMHQVLDFFDNPNPRRR